MSVENVKAFYEKLEKEEELFKKLQEKENSLQADLSDISVYANNVLIPLAKEAGFDFTVDDLAEYEKSFVNEELSDDDLDAVAGGASYSNNQDSRLDLMRKKIAKKYGY